MQNLHITNAHFITYKDDFLTVDILGGVDFSQVERMICTLRISYADYPPQRTTLDLYNDTQIEKLQRTLCDKWELKLIEVSRTLHALTMQYGFSYADESLEGTPELMTVIPQLATKK